jgi:hypothetical protein
MTKKNIAQRLFDAAYQVEVAVTEIRNYLEMAQEGLDEIDKIQKELKEKEG